MRTKLSLIFSLLVMGLVAGCTPDQVQRWISWWEDDPESAMEFASQDWVQDSLRQHRLTPNLGNDAAGDVDLDGEGTPGDCDSYRDEIAAAGLPVQTFINIARRESGCNPNSWVVDSNDTGGGLFGTNFKGNLAEYVYDLCGATVNNFRGNVPLQLKCTKRMYDSRGLDPWN